MEFKWFTNLSLKLPIRAWTRKESLMSQESLNEPTRQEPPRSSPLAETDQSPVVQKNSEGDLPPANVPSDRKALISNQEGVLQSPAALNARSGELADLEAAIMTTPPDSSDLPERLDILALRLRDWY